MNHVLVDLVENINIVVAEDNMERYEIVASFNNFKERLQAIAKIIDIDTINERISELDSLMLKDGF